MAFPDVMDMTREQLRIVNSAAKYPSILTYHAMGDRGRLTPATTTVFGDEVEVTEKIDGTNARIILPPNQLYGSFVGSREELLYYQGDVIHNPQMGIVDTVWPYLPELEIVSLPDDAPDGEFLLVIFGEVYGKGVGGQFKNYSTTTTGFRVFDVALVSTTVFDMTVEQVAQWRDRGGQQWLTREQCLAVTGQVTDLEMVPLLEVDGPPEGVAETQEWLKATIATSQATLDESGKGGPEGVVVRSPDRSQIAKIRFEDYARTLR